MSSNLSRWLTRSSPSVTSRSSWSVRRRARSSGVAERNKILVVSLMRMYFQDAIRALISFCHYLSAVVSIYGLLGYEVEIVRISESSNARSANMTLASSAYSQTLNLRRQSNRLRNNIQRHALHFENAGDSRRLSIQAPGRFCSPHRRATCPDFIAIKIDRQPAGSRFIIRS